MATATEQLVNVFTRIHRINHAVTYLNWDQMVMMPANGVEDRSRCLAELASIRHELLSSSEMAHWLAEAEDECDTDQDRVGLREMRRTWERIQCVPAELEQKQIMAGAKCEHAWRTQRGENDWNGFLENFKEVLDLARQESRLRQAAAPERFATPYDSLLDLHCTGDSSAMIAEVFAELKQTLPDLLDKVVGKQQGSTESLPDGVYDTSSQHELNKSLMSTLGFDFNSGRLDVSMHPFSTGSGTDLRITTRFAEHEFIDALMATAHETGHASYEGNLPREWANLPVGESRNMCIHESQSLLFEKQVFLARAFFDYFVPEIHGRLPSTSGISADALWQCSTRVKPSLIRVEADEVTYPMHVMLRFDIERALINGEMEAGDIPSQWDQSMQDYLGLDTRGDYTNGCLQDIHWTDGAFGYFPSYTLGAINGAQLFSTIREQFPDWQDRLASGSVSFVREWLRENIWSKGCSLESQELMQQATGQGTTAQFLIDHLEARYLEGAL